MKKWHPVDRLHRFIVLIDEKIIEHLIGRILFILKIQFFFFFFFCIIYSWLRRKYEQSKEEQRQLRLEARRLRRRQRRSIKRFQLQQDLQLAKSFGYS
jgi:hypothetical protein